MRVTGIYLKRFMKSSLGCMDPSPCGLPFASAERHRLIWGAHCAGRRTSHRVATSAAQTTRLPQIPFCRRYSPRRKSFRRDQSRFLSPKITNFSALARGLPKQIAPPCHKVACAPLRSSVPMVSVSQLLLSRRLHKPPAKRPVARAPEKAHSLVQS